MHASPVTSFAPHWFAVAPHRALFAVGTLNLLLAMAWWAVWLVGLRLGHNLLATSPWYPGWLHALLLPYLVFAPFIFGFLFTVFPRWMAVPAFNRWHYLPVSGSLLLAQLLWLLGSLGSPLLLHLGVLLALAGWCTGLLLLGDRLRQDNAATWHARSVYLALLLGGGGLLAVLAFQLSADPEWLRLASKLGIFGLLLPVYFTVAHRMFPFFAQAALPGYRPWRPLWLLVAMWPLMLLHLLFEWAGLVSWSWLVDLPLALLGLLALWRWWPRQPAPALLRVLFIGFGWWPLAFALYSLHSLALWLQVPSGLGLAPLHALTIGLFGSLLVAMISRVIRGHSGRALQLGLTDRFAFIAIQLLAALRVGAELGPDPLAWNAVAAAGWVVFLLPWLLQCGWMLGSARVDGRPG